MKILTSLLKVLSFLQIFQRTSLIRNMSLKQQTLLFLFKSNTRNGQKPKRSDTCTSYQKYLHLQKSRPNTCNSTRNVFSKLYFEQSARYINSHLERQSDRDIPKLSYRSGMKALSKMSEQEIPGLCLLTIFSLGGMMGSENMQCCHGYVYLSMTLYSYRRIHQHVLIF